MRPRPVVQLVLLASVAHLGWAQVGFESSLLDDFVVDDDTPEYVDTSATDTQEILRTFYQATGGDTSWTNASGWSDFSIFDCTYFGVTCYPKDYVDQRRVGQIRAIQLPENNLVGTLPCSIFKLPYLEILVVRGNPDLVVALNDTNNKGFEQASFLRVLDISSTSAASIGGIQQASQLEYLYVTSLQLSGTIPESIYTLTALKALYANDNAFSGPLATEIGTLTSLEALYLSGNDLTGQLPASLGSLTKLTTLALGQNSFRGSLPEELNQLTNLESLAIHRVEGEEKGPGISYRLLSFANLAKISEIKLQNQQLTGSIPQDFIQSASGTSTIVVDLFSNNIVGTIPATLISKPQLNLYLGDNHVSTITADFCSQVPGWMNGDVATLGCAAILCSPGSWASKGRAGDGEPCKTCGSAFLWGTTTCEADIEKGVPINQRDILTRFYEKMGGRYWIRSTNWTTDAPVCDWEGVLCSDSDRVSGLRLSKNGLTKMGSESPWQELFTLPELQILDLSSNDITFAFDSISSATNLHVLDLSDTGLKSLDGIEQLSSISLILLSLASNGVKGQLPDSIFTIKTLEVLDLSANIFSGNLPADVASLSNMRRLDLSGNQLTGYLPSELAAMPNLSEFHASDNRFSGSLPTQLNLLVNLQELAIDNNSLSGPLPSMENLAELTSLRLRGNSLTGTLPSTLLANSGRTNVPIELLLSDNVFQGKIPAEWSSRFSKLFVDLSNNKIMSIGSGICSRSEWMDGIVGSVGDSCDAILCPAGTYNEFGRKTSMDDECEVCPISIFMGATTCGGESMGGEIDILKEFYLTAHGDDWIAKDGWMSTDDYCSWFGITCDSSNKVARIVLPKNGLYGAIDAPIFKLSGLVELNLANNDLTFSLDGIVEASNLQILNLSQLGFNSLEGIGKAGRLVELYADENAMPGFFPDELLLLTNLEKLHLSYNMYQGTIPAGIANLVNLQELSLLHNRFTGALPGALGSLTSLRVLSLSENNFVGSLPLELNALSNLELLAIQREGGKDGISKGDIGVNQGFSEDAGPGLTGRIPSLNGLRKIKKLFLGVNSLSGSLPVDFLDGVEDKSAPIQVDLTSNDIEGTVPSSLARFDQMMLYLAGNKISGIADGICRQSLWMNGEVGKRGCSAILCEAGTQSELGRATASVSCSACSTDEKAEYFGSFKCLDLIEQKVWDEREILIDLFKATDGTSWQYADGWLDDDVSICDWYGIACTEDGTSVERIMLQQNGLNGATPTTIYLLPSLRELSFAGNSVNITFTGISKASSLESMNLDRTGLRSLQGIEGATGLKQLSAASNDFQDVFPSSLFKLYQLRHLELSDNSLQVNFPSALGTLGNLESFSCSRCGLVGTVPSDVGFLRALTSLKLDMNNLNGSLPLTFENLQQLSVLDLSNQLMSSDMVEGALSQPISVGLEGNIGIFSNFTQLTELHLQNNRFSSSLPSSFMRATSLRTLDLRRNRITGAIPEELSKFETLEILLADNMIDDVPQSLCSLSWNGKQSPQSSCDNILCSVGSANGLGYATASIPCEACPGGAADSPYFGGTSCGPDLEREILDQLFLELNGEEWKNRDGWYGGADTCQRVGVVCNSDGFVVSLLLRGNYLRGFVTPRIWLLSHLVELDLSNNEVELSLDKIAQMGRLQTLKLAGTYMRSLDGIGGATALTALYLENNLLVGQIPEDLYKLTKLERLYLDHNVFTGTISTSIEDFSRLEELYLSNNDLSGSLDVFESLTMLRVLSLGRCNFTGTVPESFSYLQSLEVLNLGAENRNIDGKRFGSGFSGPLPSFHAVPKLRELNLASNSFSGTIPANFLGQADVSATVNVDLDNNNVVGTVPGALARFSDLRISLANNFIDTVDSKICSMSAWMGGLLGSGCDAFLCSPGTYNSYGRRLPNEDCLPCNYRGAATYYGSTFCGAVFPRSLSQFEILTQFWEASNGPNWSDSSGWTTNPNVCEWFGVSCITNPSGRDVVVAVDLSDNNLQWDASSIVFHLPHLTSLKLANNPVKLELRDIFNADKLEEIDFSSTRVTSLTGIGAAKQLKVVKGARNALYGNELPDELLLLSNLVHLDISGCGLVGSIGSSVATLSNLEVFEGEMNDLSGELPEELFRLQKLRRLVLSGNNLVGTIPSSIEESTWFEILALDARTRNTAGLSGRLPSLASLTKLKVLDLGSNSLTGAIPSGFLSSVQSSGQTVTVRLDGNLLTGQVPSSLSSVVTLNLDLADNEIKSLSSNLCSMSNWWDGDVGRYGCEGLLCPAGTFSASGRQSSDQDRCQTCPGSASQSMGQTICPSVQRKRNKAILELLFDSTSGRYWNRNDGWKQADDVCDWFGITCGGEGDIEIQSIDLGSNQLVGQLPSEIFDLPGLQSLSLYSNPIDFSFDGIEQATSLTSLQLDSVGLRSLRGVGKATSLVELMVRFNSFKGSLPEEIAQLTNLELLLCGDSELTGRLPTFDKNPQLSAVRIGGNKFTGPLPSFSIHPRLRTLDVSDNQLTGDIPDDFLAASDASKPIFLDLSDNELSGTIPASLLRFPFLTIFARDNRIEGISPTLCSMENWNEGDVELYKCDAILCPPYTFSPKGRASEGETCIYCKDAPYFGSSTCRGREYGKSSTTGRFASALVVLLVGLVSAYLSL